MTNNNQTHDKDFDSLYENIFDTLVRSPAIKREFLTLLRKGKLNSQTIFILMLKTNELLRAIMQSEMNAEERRKSTTSPMPVKKRLPKGEKGQFIDGKKLSTREIEFEEYCRRDFDADEWLRGLGISSL